ncbi:TetR/AcrR family transcriptional regulator [Kineococcus sp. GCM10028916]|uniref:TetR/AcrR family transcriptional regulator n=1 Tax=Kineococcus sp. GCM10028916 TaxID=3273394 RepID=UPI0036258BA3
MAQATGELRPGGRTAKTRESVHAAVRALVEDGGPSAVTMAAVAARAGVHQATLYRRWRTPEALVLDVAAGDVASAFPVPASGDLSADLTAYLEHLIDDLARPGSLGFLRAMIAAAEADGIGAAQQFSRPRLEQFQAMLDADGASELTSVDLFEIVLAPVFMWALLSGIDVDTTRSNGPDVARIVDTVLAVRTHRQRQRGSR